MNHCANIWAPFTEAEREIMLIVFRTYFATREHGFESVIASEILSKLYHDLELLEVFANECKQKRSETA